jgi:hypothetical protein
MKDITQDPPKIKLRENEEVVKVSGYDYYWVTSQGRVFSTSNHRGRGIIEITQTPSKDGYPRVTLYRKGKSRVHSVHCLVLDGFIGPRPKGMHACHNDGTRDNNRLDNLRWDTRVANEKDKIAHGTAKRGEERSHSKLNDESVREIRLLRRKGMNKTQLGKKFGVSGNAIKKVLQGKTWSHVE